MLARLGYPVKVDGQFGPHTATMVRTLRADAGLDRSARVTKRFLRILRARSAAAPATAAGSASAASASVRRARTCALLQNDAHAARLSRP